MGDDPSSELIDQLAEEFIDRQRNGEHPTISEYERKHPQLAEEIRELFPIVCAMEELKQSRDRAVDVRLPAHLGRIKQLGEFVIIRELGRGGMGVVFEARQESLNRSIALKVLPEQSLFNDDAVKRFQREAHIAARLAHPHIVPIYSIGQAEGCHFIAMQRIRGVGWDRLVARLAAAAKGDYIWVFPEVVDKGRLLRFLAATPFKPQTRPEHSDAQMPSMSEARLSPDPNAQANFLDRRIPSANNPYDFGDKYVHEVAAMGIQAANALAFAHSQNILHRDVKTANLILDVNGHVLVTDFGIAKALESEDITTSGMIAGTLRFMSPEQFDGRADARSDIYSLGLTLYELLTLRPAFQGKSQSDLMRRILYDAPPPPRAVNPQIPSDLQTILVKATARNPDLRYQTAEALGEDLQRFLDGHSISANAVKILPKAQADAKSNAIGVWLLIAVAMAGVIFALWPDEESDKPSPSRIQRDSNITESRMPAQNNAESNKNEPEQTETSKTATPRVDKATGLVDVPEKPLPVIHPLPLSPPPAQKRDASVSPQGIEPTARPAADLPAKGRLQNKSAPRRPPPEFRPAPRRGPPVHPRRSP